jgi:hypothetical protein
MVARTKSKPAALVVVFERDGEEPKRVKASSGRQALAFAVGLLITNRELQPGDRLTVEAAE